MWFYRPQEIEAEQIKIFWLESSYIFIIEALSIGYVTTSKKKKTHFPLDYMLITYYMLIEGIQTCLRRKVI